MRLKFLATAATILAGAHSASFVVNQSPQVSAPIEHNISDQLAQGYYWGEGMGPRVQPRSQRNPAYDREWQPYSDEQVVDPEEQQYNENFERWRQWNRQRQDFRQNHRW